MKHSLSGLRNIALAAFATVMLAKPAIAQPISEDCYSCGTCTCCDEDGKVACFIDCGSLGYCDCCGFSCMGSNCS